MLEAERLHRDAALLSNRLADFADDDVDGRSPVVEQILAIRQQWSDVRYEIEHGQPRRKPETPKPTSLATGQSEAELRLELQKLRVNVSKYQAKLAERPDHKKAFEWHAELERLLVLRQACEEQLIALKYGQS